MDKFMKISAMAAMIGAGAMFAIPASADLPTDADCKAEFSSADKNRNQRLDTAEYKEYDQVKSQVDVNNDGQITADEYIVACKQDTFNKHKKQGS